MQTQRTQKRTLDAVQVIANKIDNFVAADVGFFFALSPWEDLAIATTQISLDRKMVVLPLFA
jgi:hypothetical protein